MALTREGGEDTCMSSGRASVVSEKTSIYTEKGYMCMQGRGLKNMYIAAGSGNT